MDTREARIETANRLQFSENAVTSTVKEKLATGDVIGNPNVRVVKNSYEKLAQEEVEELRKMVGFNLFSFAITREIFTW